ncbi:hypothetical protein BY458DRAFT_442275 [Sporodiniella umbellata]|nr:hypothetical protein BY458DRAFT_442275 [Sporodiniella umbellata]
MILCSTIFLVRFYENGQKTVFHNHPTSSLTFYNTRLADLARNRSSAPEKISQRLKQIFEQMEAKSMRYDIHTYNALLSIYSRTKDNEKIRETLEEMEKNGFVPGINSYNRMLEGYGHPRDLTEQLQWKQEIVDKGLVLNSSSYYHLLRGQQANLAMALSTFEDMKKQGITPTLAFYPLLIHACRSKECETAFGLLKEAENSGLSLNGEPRVYFDVMRLCADMDKIDLVSECWGKAIETLKLRPDEGVCLQVLRVAAKVGDTKLATDVIRQLSTTGYPYKEHYFTPLMEAFLVKDDLKSAFNVLDIMRISGIPPTLRAVQAFREKISESMETVDKAYYILEELHKENKPVDVAAFNVVLAACADAGDVDRTISTYREAVNLGVQPNVDTYNSILDVCIKGRVHDMDSVVISEMKKANVSPNVDTYVKMIELSCYRVDLDSAFKYLETMKEYGILPPHRCYIILANKLSYLKDPRFHLVIEEMETYGYKVSNAVRLSWKNSTQS